LREHKFRGKRKDNGEWVYWNEFGECSEPYVCQFGIYSHISKEDIIPETVGQFTGLKDVNGIDIHEGDIVRTRGGITGVIEFGSVFIDEDNYPICWFIQCKTPVTLDGDSSDWLMVIGDIHDNPSLMEAN
jgi:uncharacterized phage protein (TIGR01671 family)